VVCWVSAALRADIRQRPAIGIVLPILISVLDTPGPYLFSAVAAGDEHDRNWLGKQHGTMRRTKHRGRARVATDFMLNLIAYNLIRIPKLLAA
jgi:hypothetical protein